jgi:hypothetical protein
MVGTDAASQMVQQQNQQGSAQIKGYLGGRFDAPKYDYSIGADAQKYSTGYKDPNAYQGMRENAYKDITGRELTTGQKSLQSQFDSLSGLLDSSRAKGAEDFTGLETQATSQAEDIGKQIADVQCLYGDLSTQAAALNAANATTKSQYEDLMRRNQSEWDKAYGSLGNYYLDTMNYYNSPNMESSKPYANKAAFQSELVKYLSGTANQSNQSKTKMNQMLQKAGVDTAELMKNYQLDAGAEYTPGAVDPGKQAQFNYIADILGQKQIDSSKGKKASINTGNRNYIVRGS